MNTKTDGISSGLVAVAHMMQSPDGQCMGSLPFAEEGTAPVVRFSDAEANLSECVTSYEKEVAGLKAVLDAKDAELLDYIQNHGATIQIVPMANRTFGFEVGGLHKSRKLSVREAIDAAMQEDKP